jgi:hypothetical protein
MVLDVGSGLFEGQRLKVIADVDALVESLEALELEEVAKIWLAEKEESERGSGIHISIEPEAEFVE